MIKLAFVSPSMALTSLAPGSVAAEPTPSQHTVPRRQAKSVQMMVTGVLSTSPQHTVHLFMSEFPDVEGNICLPAYHGRAGSSSRLTRELTIA